MKPEAAAELGNICHVLEKMTHDEHNRFRQIPPKIKKRQLCL